MILKESSKRHLTRCRKESPALCLGCLLTHLMWPTGVLKVTFPVLPFTKKVGRTVCGVGVVFSICDRRRRPVSLVITSRYGETLEYVVWGEEVCVGGGSGVNGALP